MELFHCLNCFVFVSVVSKVNSGLVSIDHNSQIINFGDDYNDPIVIFGVLTLNGGAHAHIRISSITNSYVEAKIQESDECNK